MARDGNASSEVVRSATRVSAAAQSNLVPQSTRFASLGTCRVVSLNSGMCFLKIVFLLLLLLFKRGNRE